MTVRSPFRAISWRAPEYLFRKKSLIWYVNVSVFFFLAFMALFSLQQWPGVIIVTLLFWFFIAHAQDRPRVIAYSIDRHGIHLGERIITYGEIAHFSLDVSHISPVITLELNYSFAMPITMVVKKEVLDDVMENLSRTVSQSHEFSLFRWITHRLHY